MSTHAPERRPLLTDPNAPARIRRAEALRRRALSPIRILLMILMLPVTTAVIGFSVYLRTSDFEQEEAVLHLIAMAGCPTALKVIPGPYYAGELGYHLRNDPDGNGVACETPQQLAVPVTAEAPQLAQPVERSVGSAKFLRP
ncbi:excalibur calcium-binding domain-containing protein [Ruegeria lacuscaerulensis]|uniref:excalibur calcium-binding domain-containing protein n=1 Tax=Ruegeria lacuscaerulensis TaxID=55218 RepID=UPI001F410782|nr:excalibur calcium-binding domain-containing protein [Ruegeria lacuscaerulensis]